MSGLHTSAFNSREVDEIFSATNQLQNFLNFELSLLVTLAEHGYLSVKRAKALANQAKSMIFDVETIKDHITTGGNAVIPFLKQLGSQLAINHAQAARYLHYGATSQDVIDTSMMLQMKTATVLISRELDTMEENLTRQVITYRDQIMAGRTLMNQARPISFGFKLATWLDALQRIRCRPLFMDDNLWVVQLGGAVGNLSAYGAKGIDIMNGLAGKLGLNSPTIAWHSSRDRILGIGADLGILCSWLGKVTHDLLLMSQTEVDEIEISHYGSSSTMPHKQNPVQLVLARAGLKQVQGLLSNLFQGDDQEHERGAGGWHGEWNIIPQLFTLTHGALQRVVAVIGTMKPRSDNMARNLQATQGLIFAESLVFALAETLGRDEAYRLISRACKESRQSGKHLKDYLMYSGTLPEDWDEARLEALFKARSLLGATQELIDRVLAQTKKK